MVAFLFTGISEVTEKLPPVLFEHKNVSGFVPCVYFSLVYMLVTISLAYSEDMFEPMTQ